MSKILSERGAVCVTAIAQDDLGDGSGSPPLPPGAPPSWAGIGLGSLAPLENRRAFPGGCFAGITAGGGRLRFISSAPAASQLVTPGVSGGGGLGGGGQGHFVAAKVRLSYHWVAGSSCSDSGGSIVVSVGFIPLWII